MNIVDEEQRSHSLSGASVVVVYFMMAALGVTSLLSFGSGIYVYSQTGDRFYEKPWTTVEEQGKSNAIPCGATDVTNGTIKISNANRQLTTIHVKDGNIDIDLRTTPRICSDESLIGKTIRIDYEPNEFPRSVTLIESNLDNCIHAHAIRKRIESARTQLKNFSSAIEFSHVAISLREAEELLERLPADDPDHPRLTQSHAALHTSLKQTSQQLLDDTLLEFSQTFNHGDPIAAIPAARASLELSRFLENTQIPTWQRIYNDYVKLVLATPVDAINALEQLIEQDDATKNCLKQTLNNEDSHETCSHWLDIELVKKTFAPITPSLSSTIAKSTSNLSSASKLLEKKLTETNYEKLSHEYDRSEQIMLSLCNQNAWKNALKAPCTELDKSRNNAIRIATASQNAMEQIRIKNTAKAWRGQFAQCRKVQQADQALRKVRHCDAACQKIRSRIVDDYNALRNFSVANETWDAPTLTKVRSECRAAGCPRCP